MFQLNAVKMAAGLAGLEVERTIAESSAATIAYFYKAIRDKEQTILICDLGGCSLSVTVALGGGGVVEILSTDGGSCLTGDKIDNRVVNHILMEFKAKEGINLSEDEAALKRINKAAEEAKKQLSSTSSARISLPFIVGTGEEAKHIKLDFTRAMLEELIFDLVREIVEIIQQALDSAGLSPDNSYGLEKVILLGGSSRIPVIQKAIKSLIGKEPMMRNEYVIRGLLFKEQNCLATKVLRRFCF